jgi:hypothetical protein
VLKDNLVERWDYKFHNPKNREYEKELRNKEQSIRLETNLV